MWKVERVGRAGTPQPECACACLEAQQARQLRCYAQPGQAGTSLQRLKGQQQADAPAGTAAAAPALPVRRRLLLGKSWRELWMKRSRTALASAGESPLTSPAT